MNCNQSQQCLLYLWGEMTPSESAAFAEHLAECPLCSKQVADLEPLVRAMQSVEPEELSQELTQRIKDRLAGAVQAQSHRLWFTPRRSLAAAASIILIVGLAVLWQATTDTTRPLPGSAHDGANIQQIALTEEDYVEALALAWIAEPEQSDQTLTVSDDALTTQLGDLAASIESLLQEVDQDLTGQESDIQPEDVQGSRWRATGRTTSA